MAMSQHISVEIWLHINFENVFFFFQSMSWCILGSCWRVFRLSVLFSPSLPSLLRPLCKVYEQCYWEACLPFHSRELPAVTYSSSRSSLCKRLFSRKEMDFPCPCLLDMKTLIISFRNISLWRVSCHTWLKDSVVIYSLCASKPLWLSFCEDCNSIWV